MDKCIDCGGEVVHGEKLHEMTVREPLEGGSTITYVEMRCRQCADDYAADFWPEDYGPCPYHRPLSSERRH